MHDAIVARSDVVIQNLRPGVVERLGLGPQEVRARHPRIVYLSIAGFGSSGPSHARPGYDIAAQAESGLMSVTGEPDRLPQKVGVPIVDAAAAHLGAQAVLAALFGRERSGVGETLEVSLLETALHLQAATWCEYLGGAPEPTRRPRLVMPSVPPGWRQSAPGRSWDTDTHWSSKLSRCCSGTDSGSGSS